MPKHENKIKAYIDSLPTLKDKIRAVARVSHSMYKSYGATDEEQVEFTDIITDLFYPLDPSEEGEPPHINMEKSLEAFHTFAELQAEAINLQAKDAAAWSVRLHKEAAPEAQLTGQGAELKGNIYAHYLSKGAIAKTDLGSVMFTVQTNARMDMLKQQLQTEVNYVDAELLDNNDPEKAFNVRDVDINAVRYVTKLSEKSSEKIRTKEGYTVSKFTPTQNPEKLASIGMTKSDIDCAVTFLYTFKEAEAPMPWKNQKENLSRKVNNLASEIRIDEADPETIYHKMEGITNVLNHMEAKLSSVKNSTAYNEMIAAMGNVRAYLMRTNNEAQAGQDPRTLLDAEKLEECSELFRNLQEKTGAYLASHASTRSTDKGKGRVDAALLALAVSSPDAAAAVQDTLNAYRSSEKKPRMLDVNAAAEKYGILLGEPKYYEMHKQHEALTKDKSKYDAYVKAWYEERDKNNEKGVKAAKDDFNVKPMSLKKLMEEELGTLKKDAKEALRKRRDSLQLGRKDAKEKLKTGLHGILDKHDKSDMSK